LADAGDDRAIGFGADPDRREAIAALVPELDPQALRSARGL
jgi:hypothetical protein